MIYAMITLPDGRPFLATSEQIDSSDEEVCALMRREAPERAHQVALKMRAMAQALEAREAPTERRQ